MTTSSKASPQPKCKVQDKTLFTCSLKRVASLVNCIKGLDKDDPIHISIAETGFSGVLKISATELPENLCMWLVENFDTESRTLDVHGVKLHLRPAEVTNILGISDGGEAISNRKKSTTIERNSYLYGTIKWPCYLEKLEEDLLSDLLPKEFFTMRFILLMLGSFLVPTFKTHVHTETALSIGNLRDICKGNWATYIADYLVEGIKSHRRKITEDIPGCVYLLLVLYAEHAVVFGMIPRMTKVLPCNYWTDKNLGDVAKEVEKSGGLGTKTIRVLSQVDYESSVIKDLCGRVNVLEDMVNSHSPILEYLSNMSRTRAPHTPTMNVAKGSPATESSNIGGANRTHDYNLRTSNDKREKSDTSSRKKIKNSSSGEEFPIVRELFGFNSRGLNNKHFSANQACPLDHPPKEVLCKLLSIVTPLLDEQDKSIANYIFSDTLSKGERLVQHTLTVVSREEMQTMAPGCCFVDNIINLVSCMLTHDEKLGGEQMMNWFIPLDLVRLKFEFHISPEMAAKDYKDGFMSTMTCLDKVFIPLNDNDNHWYLMVMDIESKTITCLDSAQCHDTNGKIRRQNRIKAMARFMDKVIRTEGFDTGLPIYRIPKFEDYDVKTPHDVPQQSKGSLDCGLWVCQWMSNHSGSNSYNIQVNDLSRVNLAVSLVRGEHNQIRDTIFNDARQNK